MEYLLTFQNTHYAIHSEQTLIKQNIPVFVMPLPTSLGDFCGICLRVEQKDFTQARNRLLEADLPIEEIFIIETTNGGRNYLRWEG